MMLMQIAVTIKVYFVRLAESRPQEANSLAPQRMLSAPPVGPGHVETHNGPFPQQSLAAAQNDQRNCRRQSEASSNPKPHQGSRLRHNRGSRGSPPQEVHHEP